MKRSAAIVGCRLFARLALALGTLAIAGCTAILSPLNGIPAHRLPPQFLAQPKNNLVPVDFRRLQQDPPEQYLIDAGDTLGIFIENEFGEAAMGIPRQALPDPRSDLPPAVGGAVPVRDDGTILLTVPEPIEVRGLNLRQIENILRHRYTVREQLLPPDIKIMVSLMRKRTYRITLIRRDSVGPGAVGGANQGGGGGLSRGTVILEAYHNDVLNALMLSGGLPGVDAKNEILILRGENVDARARDAFIEEFYSTPPADPCLCFPPLPDDPSWLRIPLRLPRGQLPAFKSEDVILNDGDIVLIEGRQEEVYYIAGGLGGGGGGGGGGFGGGFGGGGGGFGGNNQQGGGNFGGAMMLPRDRDLDVIQAIGMPGGGIQMIGGLAPTQLFIIRKTPCDGQIIIAVDLNRALKDPKARPLVQAGDTLMLRYKPQEEILNFALGAYFLNGIYGRR